MNSTVFARYNKEDKCYDLVLEGTSFVVKVKQIDTNTKAFFIEQMQHMQSLSGDTNEIIDNLRPSKIDIKFKQLYEREY